MMANFSSDQDNPSPRPRPSVILHFAVTADGKVATANYTPALFTSSRDKQRLLDVRALADAVLVGRGTLETDRMSMGLPDQQMRQQRKSEGKSEYPLRVIVTASGNISVALPVFQKGNAPIVIYSTEKMPPSHRLLLSQRADVHLSNSEELDISWALQHLYEHYRVRSLVCEGGPTLAGALAHADLIDEIYLTITAKVFGGSAAPTLTGLPGNFLPSSRPFQLIDADRNDNEYYLRYRRKS
jgi:riboflavin-specific deaminase-like protein